MCLKRMNLGQWIENSKFRASDSKRGCHFGVSVSVIGDYFVVGDEMDYHSQGKDSIYNAGSAYVFKNSNGVWTETQKLLAPDKMERELFGYSVDIAKNQIVVGAIFSDYNEDQTSLKQNGGGAYIYTEKGGSFSFSQKLTGSDRQHGDESACEVSIYKNQIIMGARRP